MSTHFNMQRKKCKYYKHVNATRTSGRGSQVEYRGHDTQETVSSDGNGIL